MLRDLNSPTLKWIEFYRIFYHIMDPIMILPILLKLFKHSGLSEFCSWGKDCLDYGMKNQGNIIPKGA
jgi:hypothetical protein